VLKLKHIYKYIDIHANNDFDNVNKIMLSAIFLLLM